MKSLVTKVKKLSLRLKATYAFRSIYLLKNSPPIISFSFDDFPITAATEGASILKKYDIGGTFYISFGKLGQNTSIGKIVEIDEIRKLIRNGHEIGSHTFDHANGYEYSITSYENSILDNEDYCKKYLTEINGLKNFSYPFGHVSSNVKLIANKYFRCSRTSYPGINVGKIDLNMLKGFPIYGNEDNLPLLKSVINKNIEQRGWLILYTHDVSNHPSPYGCTPVYLEQAVDYSYTSGALLLTVNNACDVLSIPENAVLNG